MLMSYAPPIVRLVLAALLMACVPAVYAQSKDPIEVGTAALDRTTLPRLTVHGLVLRVRAMPWPKTMWATCMSMAWA